MIAKGSIQGMGYGMDYMGNIDMDPPVAKDFTMDYHTGYEDKRPDYVSCMIDDDQYYDSKREGLYE